MLPRIDHLVYAVPELDAGVAQIEGLLGARAVPGGRHAGRGTRNALLALGSRTYLEIIGPDTTQAQPPSWFSVGELTTARLVTWAAAATDLDAVSNTAARNGM